jgi:hypothetical protein
LVATGILGVIYEIRLLWGGRLACKYKSRRVARHQRFEKQVYWAI